MAVLCLYQALGVGSVTVVAPLVACYPLATLAFSRLFLGGETIGRQTVVGVAIVVAGVALLLGT